MTDTTLPPQPPQPQAAQAVQAVQPAQASATYPGTQSLPSERTPLKKRGADPKYLPTLFDRLCDDTPHERSEVVEHSLPSKAQYRQIVQRDLAFLLNTTNQADLLTGDKNAPARSSTVNYGVPALAGGHLSEKRWMDIELMIRQAVLDFEPRILPHSLAVRPLLKDAASANYNVLTFEISGLLHMQPYPLEFIAQSAVDLESNRIELN